MNLTFSRIFFGINMCTLYPFKPFELYTKCEYTYVERGESRERSESFHTYVESILLVGNIYLTILFSV